jgi:hypothetical protein
MKKRAKRAQAKSPKRARSKSKAKRTTTANIVTATKKSLRPVKRVAKKAAFAAGFGSR